MKYRKLPPPAPFLVGKEIIADYLGISWPEVEILISKGFPVLQLPGESPMIAGEASPWLLKGRKIGELLGYSPGKMRP